MPNTAERLTACVRKSKRADAVLFSTSFAETIILPVPMELILIPYMVMVRERLWRASALVFFGCMTAAVMVYGLAYAFFERYGDLILDTMGWQSGYLEFQALFAAYGFWAIIAAGILPIPFQLGMIAAGATGYPLALFVLAASLSRGFRYFGLALLVWVFAEKAMDIWQRARLPAVLAAIVTTVAGLGMIMVVGMSR